MHTDTTLSDRTAVLPLRVTVTHTEEFAYTEITEKAEREKATQQAPCVETEQ